jgi:hypothetical protein
MSRFLKYLAFGVVGIVLAVSILYLITPHEIAGEPNWPKNIHQRINALGMVNVYDAESRTSLFWHHSDPDVYAVKVEKQDENHWVVVFEKRK